jgi:hypothetical protein
MLAAAVDSTPASSQLMIHGHGQPCMRVTAPLTC